MQSTFFLSIALFLTGCGGESPRSNQVAAQSTQSDTLVVSADPELQARVAELLPSLAERAGLSLIRPVRVEWRSRPELEAYLLAQLDEELPEIEADHITRSYSMLSLVPESIDLRDLLVNVYQEQVAGFYDPDSLTLWIMDDQPEMMIQTVLLHELVHAVQDQAVSLDAITAKELGSDRRAAAQAAIEGHATLVMLEEMMERQRGQPVDISEIPNIAGSVSPSDADIRAQYPALADAPKIIQQSLLFPYLSGAGFVLELWKANDGRPAPFGESLPQSTEHIMHPETFVGPNRDDPRAVEIQSDVESLFEDELGELGVRIFLEEAMELGQGTWSGRSDGWAGDRFALYESESGDGLAWFVLWDTPNDRDRFVSDLDHTHWQDTVGAQVESVTVDGLAGVRVTRGTVPETTARARQ